MCYVYSYIYLPTNSNITYMKGNQRSSVEFRMFRFVF